MFQISFNQMKSITEIDKKTKEFYKQKNPYSKRNGERVEFSVYFFEGLELVWGFIASLSTCLFCCVTNTSMK